MPKVSKFKGKVIFIPEGGDAAYEVDLDSLFKEDKNLSWCSRIKSFLASFRKSSKLEVELETEIDLNHLVCEKLEELLSSVEWCPNSLYDTYPCYIVKVYPIKHADAWEPMVTITIASGSAVDISLTDLLINYTPQDTTNNTISKTNN
jgi:hypothetical protein